MITSTSELATTIREEFWWRGSLPQACSSSLAKVRFLPARKISEGSFWDLQPRDMGNVRSDRLDDLLYGSSVD